MFILFEGSNSCGKTTKIQEYSAKLTAENIEHDVVSETSGDAISSDIRELLMMRIIAPEIEILLFTFLRYETWKKKFKKETIICDRGFLSTLVFQCCLPIIAKKKKENVEKKSLLLNDFTTRLINIYYSNTDKLEEESRRILAFISCNMHLGEKMLDKFITQNKIELPDSVVFHEMLLQIMDYFFLSKEEGENILLLLRQTIGIHEYLEIPYPDKIILTQSDNQFKKDNTDDDFDNDNEIFRITNKLYEIILPLFEKYIKEKSL